MQPTYPRPSFSVTCRDAAVKTTDPDRGGHLLRGQDRERARGRLRAERMRQHARIRARARGRRAIVVHD